MANWTGWIASGYGSSICPRCKSLVSLSHQTEHEVWHEENDRGL